MQQRKQLKNYWVIPLLAISAAIALNNIVLLLNLEKYSERYTQAAEVLYAPPFGVQIVYLCILIPIMEELIFRGVVFGLLRKVVSFAWAMLISAVVFGLYHGNLVQFVYATLCGFLLAYLRETYGSVKAPIMAHVLMNITVCTMTEYGMFTWIFYSFGRVILITVPCLILLFAVLGWMGKMEEKSNA